LIDIKVLPCFCWGKLVEGNMMPDGDDVQGKGLIPVVYRSIPDRCALPHHRVDEAGAGVGTALPARFRRGGGMSEVNARSTMSVRARRLTVTMEVSNQLIAKGKRLRENRQ
jgi:hypothetical protein